MVTSSIKFRFANARDSDAVLFEGQQILASVLRRAIAEKRDLVQLGPDGIALFDEQGNGACASQRARDCAANACARSAAAHARHACARCRARRRASPHLPRLPFAEIGAEAFVHKNSTVVVRMRAARSAAIMAADAAAPRAASASPALDADAAASSSSFEAPAPAAAAAAARGGLVIAAVPTSRVAAPSTGGAAGAAAMGFGGRAGPARSQPDASAPVRA